jgi:branched-chain amino acid transport system permease protein
VGTLLVLAGFQALTIYGSQYALVVMGALLVATVLLAPEGVIIGFVRLCARSGRRNGGER